MVPPWQQNIFSSMIAAIGRQLKQSVNVFHSFMLYRRLPKHISWQQTMQVIHFMLKTNECVDDI